MEKEYEKKKDKFKTMEKIIGKHPKYRNIEISFTELKTPNNKKIWKVSKRKPLFQESTTKFFSDEKKAIKEFQEMMR